MPENLFSPIFGERGLASIYGNDGIIANRSGDMKADIWDCFRFKFASFAINLVYDNIMPYMHMYVLYLLRVLSV